MKLTLDVNQFLSHFKQHTNDPKTKREKERADKREKRRLMREAIAKQEWDKVHGPVEIITGLTKDEFTPQVFNPEIHKWPDAPLITPLQPDPVHKNQAQKRLEKREAKALASEALLEERKRLGIKTAIEKRAELRANKPTRQQQFDAIWKKPAPREV